MVVAKDELRHMPFVGKDNGMLQLIREAGKLDPSTNPKNTIFVKKGIKLAETTLLLHCLFLYLDGISQAGLLLDVQGF